jgi:hypothetical protein
MVTEVFTFKVRTIERREGVQVVRKVKDQA